MQERLLGSGTPALVLLQLLHSCLKHLSSWGSLTLPQAYSPAVRVTQLLAQPLQRPACPSLDHSQLLLLLQQQCLLGKEWTAAQQQRRLLQQQSESAKHELVVELAACPASGIVLD